MLCRCLKLLIFFVTVASQNKVFFFIKTFFFPPFWVVILQTVSFACRYKFSIDFNQSFEKLCWLVFNLNLFWSFRHRKKKKLLKQFNRLCQQKWPQSSRLETRTKECNMCASVWVIQTLFISKHAAKANNVGVLQKKKRTTAPLWGSSKNRVSGKVHMLRPERWWTMPG